MMLLITVFLLLKQLRVKSICGVCFCDYVLQMCPLELHLQDWHSIGPFSHYPWGGEQDLKQTSKSVCLSLQVIKDCSFHDNSFRSFLLWEASCYRMRTFRKSTEKWGEYRRKEVWGSEPHPPRGLGSSMTTGVFGNGVSRPCQDLMKLSLLPIVQLLPHRSTWSRATPPSCSPLSALTNDVRL